MGESLTVRDIFEQAIEIADPKERAEFISRACGDDRQLRIEVDELLRFHDTDEDGLSERRLPKQSTSHGFTEGRTIGRYQLLEQLGEGGYGVVYKAEQSTPVRRLVALKLIKPGMDTREVIARFNAERQAMALLDHPHIAQIFDAGETEEGQPFFVMEWVKGPEITTFCDEHKLRLEERIELLIKVCQAVQHAHQKGIIHRDIKPSNVLVAMEDGLPHPYVIDFGIAKAIDQRLTEKTFFTRTNQIIGTPQYMSPEQAARIEVDTRTDVYSLGVLLYELLTGSTPLDTRRMRQAAYDEICRIIREEDPPPPSSKISSSNADSGKISSLRQVDSNRLRRLVQGDLDWITIRSLEKDRERRYESVDALEKELQRFLDHEPIMAGPPSQLYRLKKFVRRNRSLAASIGVAFVAICAGAILATVGYATAREQTVISVRNYRDAQEQRRLARASEFASLLTIARTIAGSHQIGQQIDGIRAIRSAKRIADELKLDPRHVELRTAAISCLAYPDLTLADRWDHVGNSEEREYFDGSLVNFSYTDDAKNQVVVMHLPDRSERRFAAPGRAGKTGLSPKADYMVIRDQEHTHAINVDTSETILKVRGNYGWWQPYGFNQDGSRFAVATPLFSGERFLRRFNQVANAILTRNAPNAASNSDALVVRVYEMPTGKRLTEIVPPERVLSVCLSRDGKRLVTGHVANEQSNSTLRVYDVDSSAEVHSHTFSSRHGDFPTDVSAIHPQDHNIVAFNNHDDILVRDFGKDSQPKILDSHPGNVSALAFHPSGKWLLSAGYDDTTIVWDIEDRIPVLWANGRIRGISNSGTRVAIRNMPYYELHDFHDGRAFRSLPQTPNNEAAQFMEVHPNGRLAVSGGVNSIRFWDLENGRIVHQAFANNRVFRHAKFSSDGNNLWLATEHALWNFPLKKNRIESADTPAIEWKVGPPTKAKSTNWYHVVFNDNGTKMATRPNSIKAVELVFDADDNILSPDIQLPNTAYQSSHLSPDGKWLAVGTHHGKFAEVYNAQTGERHWRMEMPRVKGRFSPDGNQVVFASRAAKKGLVILDVGRREPHDFDLGFAIGSNQVRFSRDGRLLAVSRREPAGIVLIDTATYSVIAELIRKDWPQIVMPISFIANDTKLVAGTSYFDMGIWDLGSIRAELKKLDLDWPHPPLPPQSDVFGEPYQMRVEIEWGDLSFE